MGRGDSAGTVTSAVLALALAGCVAGAEGPSPTDPHGFAITTTVPVSTTTQSVEEGIANFEECMAEEGVAIDEVRLDGLGRPLMSAALARLDLTERSVLDALETCGRHLAAGPLGLGADPELAELVQETLGEFAECVRLEGVPRYPDPVPEFDGVGAPFPTSRIPWDDPDLPRAVEECSERLGL